MLPFQDADVNMVVAQVVAAVGFEDGFGGDDVIAFAAGGITVITFFLLIGTRVVAPTWKRASKFFKEQDKVLVAADRMSEFLDWHDEKFRPDWDGSPEDAGHQRTPGVMERLNRIDGEFQRDGNGSLKSQVSTMSTTLGKVKETVDSMVSPTHGGEDNRINTDSGSS